LDFANALLTETVSSGNTKHVRAMLQAGADPNQTSQGGQTPIILAIASGNIHLVNLLLDAGADPSKRDHTGLNAIEWAERKGLPEVAQVLRNPSSSRVKVPPIRSPAAKAIRTEGLGREATRDAALTSDEKTRKWIAGLKQRLDEQADRERVAAPVETVVPASEAINEPTPSPDNSYQTQAVEESRALPKESPTLGLSSSSSARKRCPKCNAVYNSPLVAYCAYHVVPLVDIDAPGSTPPPTNRMTPLLWVLILVTFVGAGIAAYVALAPLTKQNLEATAPAALPPQRNTSGKGIPVVSGDLRGKALVLPEVDAPSKLTEPVTISVRIKVDRQGRVYSARATGGDEQLREAALQSARKAEFSTQDLSPRGTQGTITYTFKP
jgi:hypothetical protein